MTTFNTNPQPNAIDEIEELRTTSHHTMRSTVKAMEEILYKPIPVLDHGFIRVIDYMGDDYAIVQSARVSYGKGTKKVLEDKGLINYLMRNYHSTPFEMCELKLHIKLPIFIARQWIRHRTANVNEYSARYSLLSKEFYLPKADDLSTQSSTNKQSRGTSNLPQEEADRVLFLLKDDAERCYAHYLEMLNLDEESGELLDTNKQPLARELARMNLTLNYYTQWYWKIDLHNLLHFIRLRVDEHAQLEIREYARVILDIVSKWVPYTYEAFLNYQLNAVKLSCSAIEVVRRLVRGEKVQWENSGLSKREWNEMMKTLELEV